MTELNATPLEAKVAVDDETFLRQFEEATLPRDQWHHREHVRTAYLYLTRYSFEDALQRMRKGIKALNAAHGTPETPGRGYHETMTQSWIRLVYFALREHGPARNGNEFYEQHPELSQPRVLRLFYSRELLSSPEAKMNFVPPDLAAFPVPRSVSKSENSVERPDAKEVGVGNPAEENDRTLDES